MARTLGAMLGERTDAIVGRERERGALRELLEADGPVVTFLYGLAGVGKSTLVRAFADDARTRSARVISVDGHDFPPTRRSLAAAIGKASATPGADDLSPEAVALALGAHHGPAVLVIDAFELLEGFEAWLCRDFVPGLPENVRVLLAGRRPPAECWQSVYGPALSTVVLGNLPTADAVQLLNDRGIDEASAKRLNTVARGHPLSLELAVGALRARPGLALEAITVGPIADELTRLYLGGLDPDTKRALDAASVMRRITVAVLEAMLPDEPAVEAFERLRALPFVHLGPEGLQVHDTVREATAALLRASDPETYWRLRSAAWGQLRALLRGAPQRDVTRYTADMLYLIEDEAVRERFFPPAVGEQAVEPAAPGDRGQIEAVAREWMDDPEIELLRAWWEAAPSAFIVARDDGDVAGFACLSEPGDVSTRLLDRDPLATAWRDDLRRNPVPPGQRSLFLRFMTGGSAGSPAQSALLLNMTGTYMAMRPELRRVYAPARDFVGTDPTCAMSMGYLPMRESPDSVCVDFGPASVDGWLDEIGARELQVGAEGALLPTERRLVLDQKQIDLTRLEAEVLDYLQRRTGAAVKREELLREVWGYDWSGGSNVVEVVISSLRRKLGDRASDLKTVRGVGYRLESSLSA